MDIRVVDIKSIIPYYDNPRNNEKAIPVVMESIKRYGFIKPIICDDKGVIVVGHTRYFASFMMGLDKVPVIFSKLDEDAARKFRIADNILAEKSIYDESKLIEEIKGLEIPLDMQPFFFEDLNVVLNINHNDISNQINTSFEDNDFMNDEEEEVSYEEDVSDDSLEDNVIDEVYIPYERDGVRYMKVVCPYCGNVEEIEL